MIVFSGARSFDLLTADQQAFAKNTTVHYAPRAYEWMKDCKATSDGLTIAKSGREKALTELPPFDEAKVQSFPVRQSRILCRVISGLLLICVLDGMEEPIERPPTSAGPRMLREVFRDS